MARVRDYAAEYARRNARAKEQFGVSYNQKRSLEERAIREGVTRPKESIQQNLRLGLTPQEIRQVLAARGRAQEQYKAGEPVTAYDDFDFDIPADDELLFYH